MTIYEVTHLHSGETYRRPRILLNEHHKTSNSKMYDLDPAVEAFHRQLPWYGETKLHNLATVAQELGFSHVFLKDESTRFGLPSFKILGASWAVHRALCKHLGLPATTTLTDVKQVLATGQHQVVRLVTCTEGNWGRAVSRMAKYYDVSATIYVPGFMNEYSRDLIRGENADVRVLDDSSYDDTIAAVQADSAETGALMVMDTSWDGYEEVPAWVTEGYFTMVREAERQVAGQTNGKMPSLAIASVGVGSWAHAVVAHYKAVDPNNHIVTVEPTVAASFKESLHCGEIAPILTGDTIMNGMNCGTTSKIVWPDMRDGTFAAVTVDDVESHRCVQELHAHGIDAGPCGAATLAALKKLAAEKVLSAEERKDMVVVLFSTEGWREYRIPG